MKTRLLLALCLGSIATALSLRAQTYFNVTDTFPSSTTNWSAPNNLGNGQSAFNNRLDYTVSTGTAQDYSNHRFYAGVGTYTADWEAQVDVHLALLALSTNQFVNLNLTVINVADLAKPDSQKNMIDIAIDRYFNGSVTVPGIEANLNAPFKPASIPLTPFGNATTDAALRISFNSATTTLTAWYDLDGAASGYSWTQLITANIGASAAYDWGMTAGDKFGIGLTGSSGADPSGIGPALNLGNAYFSSFSATNVAIPEPGTYAVLASLTALGFAAWRRRRMTV